MSTVATKSVSFGVAELAPFIVAPSVEVVSLPLFVPLVFSNTVYFAGFNSPAFVASAKGKVASVPVSLVTVPSVAEGV